MDHVAEVALGIEISEGRDRTSVTSAGQFDEHTVVIDLVAHLDGTEGVIAAVQAVTPTVVVVVIDSHSPSASLLKPLSDAGISPLVPTTVDVGVAFGLFVDEVNAGRVRHTGRPELTESVRVASGRPMGGATSWRRRGTAGDVSAAIAASLALWGWMHRPAEAPEPWVAVDGEWIEQTPDREARAVLGVAPGLSPPRAPAPLPAPRGLPGREWI
jgi:hypothetical protein